MHGINVIPTICWSNHESFEWCFDGEPTHSVVRYQNIQQMVKKYLLIFQSSVVLQLQI